MAHAIAAPNPAVVFVVERGTDLGNDCPYFPSEGPTLIVSPIRPSIPNSWSRAAVQFETGAYSEQNRTLIHDAVSTANGLAETLVDHILNAFVGSKVAIELESIRYALWIWARPQFINAVRDHALYHRALTTPARHLLIVYRSKDFLRDCHASLDQSLFDQVSEIIGNDSKQLDTHRWAFGSFKYRLKRLISHIRQAPEGKRLSLLTSLVVSRFRTSKPKLKVSVSRRAVSEEWTPDTLDQWFSRIDPSSIGMPAAPRILVSTDWHLKTVPATLQPVIKRLVDQFNFLFLTFQEHGHQELTTAVGKLYKRQLKPGEGYLSPRHIHAALPKRPAKSITALENYLTAAIDVEPEFESKARPVRKATHNVIINLCRENLWQILGWSKYCRVFFSDRKTLSLSCPGRQWHSEIAHIHAEEMGRNSMTIQNAYMSAGYTYTCPTGRLITAIDSWSRQLYVEEYDIRPEKILVAGAPRFDELQQYKKAEKDTAKKDLGFQKNSQVLSFAAQPGLEREAKMVIEACGKVGDIGQPIIYGIKLHPRSPRSLVDELLRYAAVHAAGCDVRVLHDISIHTLLVASDIVSTVYSNVGIEAAILKRTVIVAKFSDEEMPMPLDRMGVGITATTVDDFAKKVREQLTDKTAMARMRHIQDKYLEDNPAMANGSSTEMIANAIASAIV